jgi:hypothetical protein
MEIIVACAALMVAAGLFVLVPLFRGSENSLDIELMAENEMDRLIDRKMSIYRNLKDLALEYKMGRLSDEDFRHLEADYKKDAAVILEELEQLDSSEGLNVSPDTPMEKEISSGQGNDTADRTAAPGGAKCPSCGSEIIPGKKFCADCGRKL